MSHQSEAILENNLIKQLRNLSYSSVKIQDGKALVANLQSQLALFNETTFTAKEFDAILNHLAKGNVFEKAKTLRDRFQLTKEDFENMNGEIIVFIKTFDDMFSTVVAANTSYTFKELIYGAKFKPMYARNNDNSKTILNLDNLNEYEILV